MRTTFTFACKLSVLLIAAFCFFVSIQAQKPLLKFKNISTAQGLSINNASCILQDSKGFIWIGTRDGLNKYDGYRFTVFRNDPADSSSISGNYIWCLKEDKEGNIWIGTVEGGLSKYIWQTDKFVRYMHEPKRSSSLSDNTVQSILEDAKGSLWVGTAGGLDLFEKNRNSFFHFRHDLRNQASLSDNNVDKLFEDSQGHLWVGTRTGGLDQLEGNGRTFSHLRNDPKDPKSISENSILSIFEDREHNLWVGTDSKGLNLLDRKTHTFTRWSHESANENSLPNNTVRCIAEDSRGLLWLGTENGGVSTYDKTTHRFYSYKADDRYPFSIGSNSVWDVYQDRTGNMWLATYGGGVEFLDNQPEKFACYRKEPNNDQSLSNNNVNTFCEDRYGRIWIGTDGGGITVFNPKEHSFVRQRQAAGSGLTNDVILTIKQGKLGNILVGTFRGGLFELAKPSIGKFTMFPVDSTGDLGTSSDMIGNLEEDGGGNWWVGTWHGGLNYYDSRKGTFAHYKADPSDAGSIGGSSVQSLFKDSKGRLWVGTMGGGLSRLDRGSGKFKQYRHDDSDTASLSNDIVNYIMEDSKGRLWLGTNNGLDLFDPIKNSFKKYFQKDGLPNSVIQGILEDNKADLWIATNNGISRFNPQTLTFRNYEYSDGLQGTVFNRGACLRAENGDMFFGGSRGFNVFNPDKIRENGFIPAVYITDFQIFNKSVKPSSHGSPLADHISVAKDITLSYDQSVFSFEFAALNYTIQEKNQYAYKMEGFDKDWNVVGTQRKATYTNLDPGHYVFRVIASNNDGSWNLKGTSIGITVTPPFWATWWFRLIIVFLLLSSAYAFYRHRMNVIQARRKALEERVVELDKAVAQGKFEIASDVLHDIGNAIVGFGSYLNRIRRLREEDKPENLEKLALFFEANISALAGAIGTEKAGAVIKMLKAMAEAQANSHEEIGTSITEQLNVVQHIQEILHIQRQYISGKHSQERRPINIRTVVNDCLAMLAMTIQKSEINLSVNIPADLPLIKGDRTKLMQVFLHVLKNSIEAFGPQAGNKDISITAAQGTGRVIVEINDTGEGFDEDIAKRTFEKGFTTRSGAAGLGLYNCRDIIESHSGIISLNSRGKLKGSLVCIAFPI